jgi:hypothetical protein
MKIRFGFVSNSSSTSFIVAFPKEDVIGKCHYCEQQIIFKDKNKFFNYLKLLIADELAIYNLNSDNIHNEIEYDEYNKAELENMLYNFDSYYEISVNNWKTDEFKKLLSSFNNIKYIMEIE